MSEQQLNNALYEALKRRDFNREKPFLVLGTRRTSGKIVGGKYPISDEMAPRLSDVAKAAKVRAMTANMSDYDGFTVLHAEEGLWVPASRLRDEAPLLTFLGEIDDEDILSAEQVVKSNFSFYAIGFGADDNRIFFVREKAQQISAATKIFGFIEASLRPVESPILSLDATTDFILLDGGAVVFGSNAFEKYIQEPSEIAGNFDSSMDTIAKQVPFDASTLALVKSKGHGSTLVRGRVRSVLARRYLSTLTIERIQEKILEKRLAPERFIADGKLKFVEKDTIFVLKLLDQKVWKGDFDDEIYSTSAAVVEKP